MERVLGISSSTEKARLEGTRGTGSVRDGPGKSGTMNDLEMAGERQGERSSLRVASCQG